MNNSEECFAYAEHLHHEHGRLNRLLLEIGHEVAQLGRPEEPASLRDRLGGRITDLRKQLQSHYTEEEAGGCLEEAVTRCPSLASDTKTILQEHLQLDHLLDALIRQFSDPGAKPSGLQAGWKTFYTKIQIHEAAETRLLQMAFGSESADSDVEADD